MLPVCPAELYSAESEATSRDIQLFKTGRQSRQRASGLFINGQNARWAHSQDGYVPELS